MEKVVKSTNTTRSESHEELRVEALTNCCLGGIRAVKFDHTSTSGAAIGLILDLGAVDLADRGEKIDQILIASRPGQLIPEKKK